MRTIKAMQPIMKLMEERLGVSVKPASARDYDDFIEKMAEASFDVAFLAPIAYVEARERTGYEVIARPVREGSDSYTSIIIARADGPVRTLADLKGRTFAFADERSASGYVFPKGHLLQHGIDPNRDLRKVAFVGGHDNVVLNVLRREYDAGAVYNDARRVALKGDEEKIRQLRIVAVTKPIPNEPVTVSPRFRREHPDLAERIAEFFATLHETPEGREALRLYSQEEDPIERYVPARDADYDDVRAYVALTARAASRPPAPAAAR
jgi:phosphonate transport system substrate-binding protein